MIEASAELHQMATLGRLSIAIAHEINSPIGSVLSNNGVLRRSLERLKELVARRESAALDQAAQVIDTCRQLADIDRVACERVRNLIRGMKTFARLDDGEARLTDINKELEETVSLAACQFRHGITCNLQLSELPKVVVHPQLLNQVFLNLLVNSAQAIGSEGQITVRTELEPGQIHIAFRDTGSGMTPQQKARVFQQGFTTKAPGEGSGLGLAMSREIIEDQHRGSLTFESEASVGTTFHVRLPLTKEHSA